MSRLSINASLGFFLMASVVVLPWPLRGAEEQSPLQLEVGGHQGRILKVAFLSSGLDLVSVGSEGTIRRWDASTGKLKEVLCGPKGLAPIISAEFSPKANMVAFCKAADHAILRRIISPQFPISILSLESHKTIQIGAIANPPNWNGMAFSPDGKILAVADGAAIALFEVSGEKQARLAGHTERVTAIAFSPDGSKIASASEDATLRLWSLGEKDSSPSARIQNAGSHVIACRGHRSSIWALAWAPDNSFVATADSQGALKFWNTDGIKTRELPIQIAAVLSLAVSPDCREIFLGGSDSFTVDLADPFLNKVLIDHSGMVFTGAYSQDGLRMATGGVPGDELFVRAPKDHYQIMHRLKGQGGGIAAVEWGEDVRAIRWGATPHPQRGFFRQEPVRGAIIAIGTPCGGFEPPPFISCGILSAQFPRSSPNDRGYITNELQLPKGVMRNLPPRPSRWDSSRSGRSLSWDEKAQKVVVSFGNKRHTLDVQQEIVQNFSFAGDQLVLVTTGPFAARMRFFFAESGNEAFGFGGHGQAVTAATVSPDGRFLLTGSADRAIRVWDLTDRLSDREDPRLCFTLFESEGEWILWTKDGHYLASDEGARYLGRWQHEPEKADRFVPIDESVGSRLQGLEAVQEMFDPAPTPPQSELYIREHIQKDLARLNPSHSRSNH